MFSISKFLLFSKYFLAEGWGGRPIHRLRAWNKSLVGEKDLERRRDTNHGKEDFCISPLFLLLARPHITTSFCYSYSQICRQLLGRWPSQTPAIINHLPHTSDSVTPVTCLIAPWRSGGTASLRVGTQNRNYRSLKCWFTDLLFLWGIKGQSIVITVVTVLYTQ